MKPRRLDEVLESCRGVRASRVRCATYSGVEYCVYTYKTADWRAFKANPCLLYARGTVVVRDRSGGVYTFLPFTKFFNAGETDYTILSRLSKLRIGSVYEKLDGTLIIMWRDPVTGELRANTRGSLWSHPGMGGPPDPEDRIVNPYVRGLMAYIDREGLARVAGDLVDRYETVMLELVVPGEAASRAHSKPGRYMELAATVGKAYLLAYRGHDGRLAEPGAGEWPLQPVRISVPGSPEGLLGRVEDLGAEGVVAWYRDNPYQGPLEGIDPLVKFKSRSYLLKVTGLQSKRAVLAYVLEHGVDDLVGVLEVGELEVLGRVYEEYQRLLRGLEELRTRRGELRRRGINVRGLIARGLESPERLRGELIAGAPRDYEKALKYIERLNRTLERVLGKLS